MNSLLTHVNRRLYSLPYEVVGSDNPYYLEHPLVDGYPAISFISSMASKHFALFIFFDVTKNEPRVVNRSIF